MTAVYTFSGGAKAITARMELLRRLEKEIPGFKFEGYDYGSPSVYRVSFHGEQFSLARSQVEVFVASFRAGHATHAAEIVGGSAERFAKHQFDQP